MCSYGEIKITATYSGRIEMLGNHQAGRFEWPDTKGDFQKFLDFDNNDSANEGDFYSFALRPLLTDHDYIRTRTPSNHYPAVRAFDNGDECTSKKRLGFAYGHPTFSELLDDAVAHTKGMPGRIRVPESLLKDAEIREQLRRLWDLIHDAGARVVHVPEE